VFAKTLQNNQHCNQYSEQLTPWRGCEPWIFWWGIYFQPYLQPATGARPKTRHPARLEQLDGQVDSSDSEVAESGKVPAAAKSKKSVIR
jgi:hypothetical protein